MEVEREEYWARWRGMRGWGGMGGGEVDRQVRDDLMTGRWHRWMMDSGEQWSEGLDEAEMWMEAAEATAAEASQEAEESTAAAVWMRGADRWGPAAAARAQRRMIRRAEWTAAMADETRKEVGGVARWMRVVEAGAGRVAWQLCMVERGVAWMVEEWRATQAGVVAWRLAESEMEEAWGDAEAAALAWRLEARAEEEAREAERARWRRGEEEERVRWREDRELIVVMERALADVAADVAAEVAEAVAVQQRRGRGGEEMDCYSVGAADSSGRDAATDGFVGRGGSDAIRGSQGSVGAAGPAGRDVTRDGLADRRFGLSCLRRDGVDGRWGHGSDQSDGGHGVDGTHGSDQGDGACVWPGHRLSMQEYGWCRMCRRGVDGTHGSDHHADEGHGHGV